MTRLLVSGVGGAIGAELVCRLLERQPVDEVVGLCSSEASCAALRERWAGEPRARLRLLPCDLTSASDVARTRRELGRSAQLVGVHVAADVSWDRDLAQMWPANVDGTERFASLVRGAGRTARLVYVSSAFTRTTDWSYRNGYERSKAIAEQRLHERFADLAPVTFSPSLVVGRSDNGRIERFHGIYPILRMIDGGLPFVVAAEDARVDLVPLDWVAEELASLVAAVAEGAPGADVVASAGVRALPLRDLVALATAALNRLRLAAGEAPLEEVPVLSFRRWAFLRRSFDAWSVRAVDASQLKRFERLLDVYGEYLRSGHVREPAGVRTPAPWPQTYIDPVVGWWRAHRDVARPGARAAAVTR